MLFSVYFRNIDFSSIKTVTALEEMVNPTSRLWLSDRVANYFLAAKIDCNTPEEAFIIMQSDEHHWSMHEEIVTCDGANIRSMMVGDIIVTPSGDELLTVGNGFEAIHGCRRIEGMDIPELTNDLGQEIIDHIHSMLKNSKYGYYKHPMKRAWFGIIERICDGYFKTDGLLKVANQLNVP